MISQCLTHYLSAQEDYNQVCGEILRCSCISCFCCNCDLDSFNQKKWAQIVRGSSLIPWAALNFFHIIHLSLTTPCLCMPLLMPFAIQETCICAVCVKKLLCHDEPPVDTNRVLTEQTKLISASPSKIPSWYDEK